MSIARFGSTSWFPLECFADEKHGASYKRIDLERRKMKRAIVLVIAMAVCFGIGYVVVGLMTSGPPSIQGLALEALRHGIETKARQEREVFEKKQEELHEKVAQAEEDVEVEKRRVEAIRKRHDSEVAVLKKEVTEATERVAERDFRQASLEEDLQQAQDKLNVVAASDPAVQQEVLLVQEKTDELVSNLKLEIVDLKLIVTDQEVEIELKDELILGLGQQLYKIEDLLKRTGDSLQLAEDRVRQLDNRGLQIGVGGVGGYVQTLSGESGPGGGVGITLSYNF